MKNPIRQFLSRRKARQTIRGMKASATSKLLITGSGKTIWPERNYENYAKETYLKNIVAFRCIDLIAKSCASVPWGMFEQEAQLDREPVTDHAVAKLLKRASPEESFSFLVLKAIAYLAMAGNSYLEKVAPKTGPNAKIPKELYSLRPDRMKIQAGSNGRVAGYTYELNSKSHTWWSDSKGRSDILHLKFFHPTDDWYGAAITESAAREIDTSNEATEWNKRLLENEARPGMLVMYEESMTDDQFDRLEKMLTEKFSGADNAGRNLILEGAKDAKPYGFSPAELDFIDGNREMFRRIAFGWGVPPQLVGIPGDSTYSNYKEARGAFWEDTVVFYLTYLRDELNNWFFGDDDDLLIDFDLDNVPALSFKRDLLWSRAQESNFLTVNEKRGMVGLGEVEAGDIIFVSSTLVALTPELAEPPEPEPVADGNNFEEDEEEEAIKKLMATGYDRQQAEELIRGAQ